MAGSGTAAFEAETAGSCRSLRQPNLAGRSWPTCARSETWRTTRKWFPCGHCALGPNREANARRAAAMVERLSNHHVAWTYDRRAASTDYNSFGACNRAPIWEVGYGRCRRLADSLIGIVGPGRSSLPGDDQAPYIVGLAGPISRPDRCGRQPASTEEVAVASGFAHNMA